MWFWIGLHNFIASSENTNDPIASTDTRRNEATCAMHTFKVEAGMPGIGLK